MIDSKFLFTLVGLVATVVAICNTNIGAATVCEDFDTGDFKEIQSVTKNGSCGSNYAFQNNYKAALGNEKAAYPFVSYPNKASPISPRAASVGYGGYITYRMPDHKNLAVPSHPLAMADMVYENYQGPIRENFGCGQGSCSSVAMYSKAGDESSVSAMKKSAMKTSSSVSSDGMGIGDSVGDMTTNNMINNDNHIYTMPVGMKETRRFTGNGVSNFLVGSLNIAPNNIPFFQVSPSVMETTNVGIFENVASDNYTDPQSIRKAKIASAIHHM